MNAPNIPAEEIIAGSALHAGRLISQIEAGCAEARDTMCELADHRGRAQLVDVTGPPGAGNSALVAEVFIRSLASRGTHGGLAAGVNDAADVLDAMGKDVVIASP